MIHQTKTMKLIGYRSFAFFVMAYLAVISAMALLGAGDGVWPWPLSVGFIVLVGLFFFKLIRVYDDRFTIAPLLNPFAKTSIYEYDKVTKIEIVIGRNSILKVFGHDKKETFTISFTRADYMQFVDLARHHVEVELHDGHTNFDGYIK